MSKLMKRDLDRGSQLRRVLATLVILSDGQLHSGRQFQAAFAVTRRTVLRDMHMIESVGFLLSRDSFSDDPRRRTTYQLLNPTTARRIQRFASTLVEAHA